MPLCATTNAVERVAQTSLFNHGRINYCDSGDRHDRNHRHWTVDRDRIYFMVANQL